VVLEARRRHLESCSKLLTTLSYQGVLARGFALVRDAEGNSIRSLAQVQPGLPIDVEVADGRFAADVTGAIGPVSESAGKAARPTVERSASRTKAAGAKGSGNQGSLF
jgi:exodeoxyribonuclease VII large subunit